MASLRSADLPVQCLSYRVEAISFPVLPRRRVSGGDYAPTLASLRDARLGIPTGCKAPSANEASGLRVGVRSQDRLVSEADFPKDRQIRAEPREGPRHGMEHRLKR